jgi:hypothetical protein
VSVPAGSGRALGVLGALFLFTLPLVTVRIYAADELQYFAPLRSLWKDRDLDYRNEYAHFLDPLPWAVAEREMLLAKSTATGHAPAYATIGAALFWSPFFAAADVVARLGGWPADGWSHPYLAAVCYGSALYGFLGLCLLFRLALVVASVRAAFGATLLAWWATGLPFYMYVTPPMAHAVSFFSVTLFVWLWWRWRSARGILASALLGIGAGIMTLVRELNGLFLLLPALDLVLAAGRAIGRRDGAAVTSTIRSGAVIGVSFLLCLVPQLLVWQTLFGRYAPAPERVAFFGAWPRHLVSVLFSANHGLASWHPAWIFGIGGILVLARRRPDLGVPLASAFAAQLLFLGSVTNWPGGMAFGQRRLLDCLFVVVLGGAVVLDRAPRRLAVVTGALLVWWNLSLMAQFGSGMIPRQGPVVWSDVARNQVTAVPQRMLGIARRYLSDRESFFRSEG